MKTCSKCGNQMNDDSRFCTQCGYDTMQENQESVNPNPAPEYNTNVYQNNTQANGIYYQPGNNYTNNSTDSSGQYASGGANYSAQYANSNAMPYNGGIPTKEKKKMPVWKKLLIALAVIFGIVIISFIALFCLGLSVADDDAVDSILNGTFDPDSESASLFEPGYIDGDSYINESANLKMFPPDSSWIFMSAEETAEDYDAEIDPETGRVHLDIYYLEAEMVNEDNGSNILISIIEGDAASALMSVESTAKYIAESNAESCRRDGDTCTVSETYDMTVAGESYTCIDLVSYNVDEYGTYSISQTFCYRKAGSDFIEIQLTTSPDYDTLTTADYLESCFSALNAE